MSTSLTRPIQYGEAMPHIGVATSLNPESAFGTLAGRHILLCVHADANQPAAQEALAAMQKSLLLHNWDHRALVAVSCNPADQQHPVIQETAQKALVIWDFSYAALKAWGLVQKTAHGDQAKLGFILLDPMLRVVNSWTLSDYKAALAAFAALPKPDDYMGVPLHAPVLVVPRVFEPAFCQRLIKYYHDTGSEESGISRDINGQTQNVEVPDFKRRRDSMITDEALAAAVKERIWTRLLPEIKRSFQFQVTQLERYLVACYDATSGVFFKPHRDDTTRGTLHRRFACTINLNAEEYEGGDLRFPEFGSRTYRAPTGGAVIFSCSLLHEATPVTRGTRYAFLPFMYDDAALKVRLANMDAVGESVRSGVMIAAD